MSYRQYIWFVRISSSKTLSKQPSKKLNKEKNRKARLDKFLVQSVFFKNIEKARFAIASGIIQANGQTITHTNALTNINSIISVAEQEKYVSRGGV